MFSKDANDLALRPIERMIDKVNKIAKNPQIVLFILPEISSLGKRIETSERLS